MVAGLLALVVAFGMVIYVLRRAQTRAIQAEQAQQALLGQQTALREQQSALQEQQSALREQQAAAQEGLAQGRRDAEEDIRAVKDELRELRSNLERREARLGEREQRLDDELRRIEDKAADLDQHKHQLDERQAELDSQGAVAQRELQRVARLTVQQARAELIATIEAQAKRQAAVTIRDIESEARKEADKRARKIVTLAIQRVAVEQTSESVVSVLHLPGDEMKGRIIGREGRNIRAFESITGVNLIIDDTPEAVLLSCFDPVRREVGRLTLQRLIADGRIHPQRIEEAYESGRAEIELLSGVPVRTP